MPGPLMEYALRLSIDTVELDRFRESPESARAAMASAGLSDVEMQLMLSGNQRRICDALAADAGPLLGSTEMMEMPPGEPGETPAEEPPIEPMEMPPEAMEMHSHGLERRSLTLAGG